LGRRAQQLGGREHDRQQAQGLWNVEVVYANGPAEERLASSEMPI